MFPFVYVLVFIINDCLQSQLCGLIRLCLSQFRKCTTRLTVLDRFPKLDSFLHCKQPWNGSCPGWSAAVQGNSALTTFFQPVAFKHGVCGKEASQYQRLKVEFLCPSVTVIKCYWASGSSTYFLSLFIIWLAVFVASEIVSMYYCNLDFFTHMLT